MENTNTWKERFEQEISRGKAARAAGNEGMARVCARRAAGLVVEEALQRSGHVSPSASAYGHLRYLAALPGVPADVMAVAEHLLARITPEHTLPVEADLIAEAVWLRSRLLNEEPG